MNLNLTGNHLEITPAIRAYVVAKMERVTRHFDHVIDVSVVLSVDKLRQKIEANVHVRGKEIHAESIAAYMSGSVDSAWISLPRTCTFASTFCRSLSTDSTSFTSIT